MDKHLGDIGTVGLVVGLRRNDLHCADDAACVAGHEQHPAATCHVVAEAPPKSHRFVAGEGMHEADRCASGDAIDQNVRKLFRVGIRKRRQKADSYIVASSRHDTSINGDLAVAAARP